MADEQPLEGAGVFANGKFYRHTPHFLQRRAIAYPIGHSEATDERIRFVLENAEYTETVGPERYIVWGRIRESGADVWWMKVVVVENRNGLAVLSAYKDDTRRAIE